METQTTSGDILKSLTARVSPAVVQRELARRELLPFTEFTFGKYESNWHHARLASLLDRFAAGDVKRAMCFMPPRHGKTELVSRRLPAKIFGNRPTARVIGTSYGMELAERINRDVQRIMDMERYRKLFPNVRLPEPGARSMVRALRNATGFDVMVRTQSGEWEPSGTYRCTGVNGPLSGFGADYIIIDDPIKNREDANSETLRERVWEWYTSTVYTRLEKGAGLLLTMTRWHHDDLAGRILAQAAANPDGEQWEVISLPAVKDIENDTDPRTLGDSLWPNKYSREAMASIRLAVGSYEWEALFQQRPTPVGGSVFKQEYFKTYEIAEHEDPAQRMVRLHDGRTFRYAHLKRFIVVDLAVSLKTSADYTVMLTVGVTPQGDLLVLDCLRARLEAPDQLVQLKHLLVKHAALFAAVESVQYQLAFVQTARREGLPVREMKVDTDKLSRAIPAATLCENGRVCLPVHAPWVATFLSELMEFPSGKHDDQVDTLSGAVGLLPSVGLSTAAPLSLGKASYWGV